LKSNWINITFLLLLTSCSFFLKKLDPNLTLDPKLSKEVTNKNTICAKNTNDLMATETVENLRVAQMILSQLKRQYSLTDEDSLILWIMLQMRMRPDLASPTSRLQIAIMKNNEVSFFDFYADKTNTNAPFFPFIFGLESMIKDYFKSKKSLDFYAKILDEYNKHDFFITKDFEEFIYANKDVFKKNEDLRSHYVRGEDLVREKENVPSFLFKDILKLYNSSSEHGHITTTSKLFLYKKSPSIEIKCNNNFRQYDNSVFMIDKEQLNSHLFSLNVNNFSMIGASSQKITNPTTISDTPLLQGDSRIRGAAFCSIKKPNMNSFYFSTKSRDPGQHLFHIFKFNLQAKNSLKEINFLIKNSRHLFLTDPLRLVVEAKRSTKKKLQDLLNLHIPVYHAEQLGNIWGLIKNSEEMGLILDDRNSGASSCNL
jgi:hypothetical protein